MNNDPVLLKMRGIRKSFGATKALRGVDLDIFENEVHAIVGSNGAGKSTLMKILAGIYVPEEGSIEYLGKNIIGLSPYEMQKRGIQVVHQVLNIVGSMSVLENILLANPPARSGFLSWKDGVAKVEKTLEMIDFPLDLNIPANSLSVSEQQFIVLARAIINQTRVLVLDEPTARLGLEETNKLFSFIRKLKENGITIIYISHRLEEIYTISDRISVFRDGQLAKTKATKDFPEDELVDAMLGKRMDVFFPKSRAEISGEVLGISDLYYGDRLNGVSLSVREGEIVSLIGAVGAGKTEIVNIIYGIISRDKGTISIGGITVGNTYASDEAIKMGIALVPEDRAIQGMIGDYSVKNNLSSVDMRKITNVGVIQNKKENSLAKDLINQLNIRPNDANYLMTRLSGGNQQKVVIGKWLTAPYKLYLMDEVTAGVDIEAKAAIYEIMGDIVKNGGAILLATGDIEEALGISDRILVLFKGKVVKEIFPSETTKDELLTYIMGGGTNA